MNITLLDYGVCNVTSVERALQKLGAVAIRTTSPDGIRCANVLVLPGVGHYAALIRALDHHGLRAPLLDAIRRGVPFLGICLGLQALYDSSEEAPDLPGMKFLAGHVQALPPHVKLPHMGWNQLRTVRGSPILEGIPADAYFYFAHSYAAIAADGHADAVATCVHGTEFIAVLQRENIHAVQFHPEKSGAAGARLLQNFLRLAS